jgi:ADP-ribose pyrophosphatase YjhB (NUDIX family)
LSGYDRPLEGHELQQLAAGYGHPELRSIDIDGDEYLFATRLYRVQDRRAEVVLAIERPGGRILLHRKGWYERDVYRLLTGGVDPGESVEHSLVRELAEETGLAPDETRFLGVLDCRIHYGYQQLSFVSYVFHLPITRGALRLPATEEISAFREVPMADLAQVAESLRQVPPPRQGWGLWRAIAHDFVHEKLGGSRAADSVGVEPS